MKPLILLLCLLPLTLFSQSQITGKLLDAETKRPIEYATIYVNGTNIGTISLPDGEFSLKRVPTPCEVVFSHINYQTQVIHLQGSSDDKTFLMQPHQKELTEINVIDINRRQNNMAYFKRWFLGSDYWGKRAMIQNDSALFFTLEYSEGRFTTLLTKKF